MKNHAVRRSLLLLSLIFIVRGTSLNPIYADPGPSGGTPKVWHMKITFTKITESEMINNPDPLASARVTHAESFDPLTVEFDLGPGLKIIPASLTVDYRWKFDEKQYFKEMLLFSCEGDEHGTSLREHEFSLGRRVKPVPCEKILDVADRKDVYGQKPDTVAFDFSATVPAKNVSINYDSGEKITSEMLESISENLVLPYRYDRKVNEEKDKSVVDMPKEIALFKTFVYKLSYALTASDLKLEYVPLPLDLIGLPGVEQGTLSHRQSGEPFLAKSFRIVKGKEEEVAFYIHGNSQIIPWVDGVDRSRNFALVRYKRESEVPLDGKNNPLSGYTTSQWDADFDSKQPKSAWMDVPGLLPTGTDPMAWLSKRYLQEYLIAVHNHPEFGFLYFITIYDTTPGRYRVRMSKALHISGETWCRIKKSNKPYRTEANSEIELDSGIRKPW